MRKSMMKNGVCAAAALLTLSAAAAESRPNIVLIMCDDLGYGDVQCLNPEHGKVKTPCIDKLAGQGMTFTDAHSGSSVCTPTRYGLLTGRYSWRTTLQNGVFGGNEACLIAPDRLTVAGLLKRQGYATAILGKWHLGFEYQDPKTGEKLSGGERPPIGAIIPDGPVTRGFDYYHGFHHAKQMDRFIENDKVIEILDAVQCLPRLTEKSVAYINERAKTPEQPFFLYVPLGSPHSPIRPTAAWQGKSGLGRYGDFVMQTDATVGVIADALEKNGLAGNTLLIFTSDNGCSKNAGIAGMLEKGHSVSGRYRGLKADIWDGGHRVPFIVRWPGQVKAGSTSDQLITLVDVFATVSEITGEKAPDMAEDSVSFLPALTGQPIISTRKGVIHHSLSGRFAYREGKWKLLLAKGSGGVSSPMEREVGADALPAQLYDMQKDPGEQNNLYLSHPEVAQRLLADLTADVERGRSTVGPEATNDFPNIVLWKSGRSQETKSSRGTAPLRAAEQTVPKPNILFIMVDDLGKEWVGCYGADDIQTPNIDALAEGGMKFHNACSMGSCTPSRTTLLTGKYPWRTGWVSHWDVPRWGIGYFDWKQKENTTFARLMKDLGYATCAAGKWQINDFRIEPQALRKHGFDDWAMWTGFETGNPPSDKRYQDPYINTREAGSRTYAGKFGPDIYTDHLIKFMRNHKDEPMCLYYPMPLLHAPFVATPDEPNVRSRFDRHKAMVRYVDKMVGRLVGELNELGIRERTIIFFCSDNGTDAKITGVLNGQEIKGGKGQQSEAGVCGPFIVNGPGIVPAGIETDALTDLSNMLPTFVELGGGQVPEDLVVDGKSIAPLILGNEKDSERDWIMALSFGAGRLDNKGIRGRKDFGPRVTRDKRYKAWVSEERKIIRLYDLTEDQQEETNLLASDLDVHKAALLKFQAVVDSLPARDARPLYESRAANSWDRNVKKAK